MGILILQKNNGNDWTIKLREKWVYTDETEFCNARDYLDSIAMPYSVSFSFEVYILELTDIKSQITLSNFDKLKDVVSNLIYFKKIGVAYDEHSKRFDKVVEKFEKL